MIIRYILIVVLVAHTLISGAKVYKKVYKKVPISHRIKVPSKK